jgi:4-hydroxy-tetrahydrodipicolinate synthase
MFNKDDYGRILIPMVTPFKEDQEVDYHKAAALAKALVERGDPDSLILSGTTGEFFTMSFDERVKLFEVVSEAVGGTVPLIAGIGCASTKETIELGKRAKSIGIETMMIVAPYYTKPNQREIYEHFKKVAQNVDANLMIYNIPIFTGVNTDPPTVAKLAQIENIVAIKEEAELNPKQTSQFILETPEEFIVYCGDDTMITEAFIQGGGDRVGGVVSGSSHIAGSLIRQMISDVLEGNSPRATKLQLKLLPVLRSFGQNGRTNPVALLKEAMKLQGLPAGLPRQPLLPGTEDEIKLVRKALETAELL